MSNPETERPEVRCEGCNAITDPTTCWCGDDGDHSGWQGHSPVPMGCLCSYAMYEQFAPD